MVKNRYIVILLTILGIIYTGISLLNLEGIIIEALNYIIIAMIVIWLSACIMRWIKNYKILGRYCIKVREQKRWVSIILFIYIISGAIINLYSNTRVYMNYKNISFAEFIKELILEKESIILMSVFILIIIFIFIDLILISPRIYSDGILTTTGRIVRFNEITAIRREASNSGSYDKLILELGKSKLELFIKDNFSEVIELIEYKTGLEYYYMED